MPDPTAKMFEAPDKPFLNTLAEDIRVDPQQGVLGNIGGNLATAANKVMTRDMYRTRARQMDQAIQQWQQNQAIMRQRMMTQQQPQQPGLGPGRPTAFTE
jgi:hypothetical protein